MHFFFFFMKSQFGTFFLLLCICVCVSETVIFATIQRDDEFRNFFQTLFCHQNHIIFRNQNFPPFFRSHATIKSHCLIWSKRAAAVAAKATAPCCNCCTTSERGWWGSAIGTIVGCHCQSNSVWFRSVCVYSVAGQVTNARTWGDDGGLVEMQLNTRRNRIQRTNIPVLLLLVASSANHTSTNYANFTFSWNQLATIILLLLLLLLTQCTTGLRCSCHHQHHTTTLPIRSSLFASLSQK